MSALVGTIARGIGQGALAAAAVTAVLAISAAALLAVLVCAAPLKMLRA